MFFFDFLLHRACRRARRGCRRRAAAVARIHANPALQNARAARRGIRIRFLGCRRVGALALNVQRMLARRLRLVQVLGIRAVRRHAPRHGRFRLLSHVPHLVAFRHHHLGAEDVD